MAEKNPKTDNIENQASQQNSQEQSNQNQSNQSAPTKKHIDPILEFASRKEKSLGRPISDRTIALLRKELSKNKDLKIEEIWRKIYG